MHMKCLRLMPKADQKKQLFSQIPDSELNCEKLLKQIKQSKKYCSVWFYDVSLVKPPPVENSRLLQRLSH